MRLGREKQHRQQPRHRQLPATHWPTPQFAQVVPPDPQSFGSLCPSTHAPKKSQQPAQFAGEQVMQRPLTHDCPRAQLPHISPRRPQVIWVLPSVHRLPKQQPVQSSPHCDGATHIPSTHLPLAQPVQVFAPAPHSDASCSAKEMQVPSTQQPAHEAAVQAPRSGFASCTRVSQPSAMTRHVAARALPMRSL